MLELLPLVDVLTPNEHEAAQLLDRPFRGLQQSLTAAEELRGLGCQNVVITLGSEGAVVATASSTAKAPPFFVTPVDTTAAGDAFSGALAVALAEGQRLAEAVRFAAAAGRWPSQSAALSRRCQSVASLRNYWRIVCHSLGTGVFSSLPLFWRHVFCDVARFSFQFAGSDRHVGRLFARSRAGSDRHAGTGLG